MSYLTKERDSMEQIIILMNYLAICGLPIFIGFIVRVLLQRFNKAFLVTVAFAVLSLAAWGIAMANPIAGNEAFGIWALQVTCAFAASLLTGIVCGLIKLARKKLAE